MIVTCSDNNLASQKIIEKNGGILEDKIKLPDNTLMRKNMITKFILS